MYQNNLSLIDVISIDEPGSLPTYGSYDFISNLKINGSKFENIRIFNHRIPFNFRFLVGQYSYFSNILLVNSYIAFDANYFNHNFINNLSIHKSHFENVRLDNAVSFNEFNNLLINNSRFDGIYLKGFNNTFSSLNSIKNGRSGLHLYASSKNNIFRDFNFSNNVYGGINLDENLVGIKPNYFYNGISTKNGFGVRIVDGYDWIENVKIFDNNCRGIILSTVASSNTILNSNITNNQISGSLCEDLYFDTSPSFRILNNVISNNTIGSIGSDDWSRTVNSFIGGKNYFNSSLLGFNLGNYWDNFNCISSEPRGSSFVCNNPSFFTINSTFNVFDYAPLVKELFLAPTDINCGLNIFDGVSNINVSCEPLDEALTSPLRIYNGSDVLGLVLVNISDIILYLLQTQQYYYYNSSLLFMPK